MAGAPKTAAHKNHPKNILSEEKHTRGIVLAQPEPKIVFKQQNSDQMPNTEFLKKSPKLEFLSTCLQDKRG